MRRKNLRGGKISMDKLTPIFIGLVFIAYLIVHFTKPSVAEEGLKIGGISFVKVIPLILAGFAMAGLLQALIPKGFFVNWLGGQKGIKGVFLGTILGSITPRPIIVPLAIIPGLEKGGAGIGTMIAYLVAWDVIPLRKIPMTVALLGNWKFALLKFSIALPLTLMAGLLANWFFPNFRFFE